MALISECDACRMGDHKHHRRVIQAVPEGTYGGTVCVCRGECVERGPSPDPLLEILAKALYDSESADAS